MALQGPSGSGKTFSALLIAFGLCGDWNKIAVIDTENNSSDLYADLGGYNTLSLTLPFSPEKYIQAIRLCEDSGMEVIIIDSATHEWDGIGGILDIHSNMTGNSFTNWGKLTPRHNAFVQTMLQSPAHIITTIRSKQDYVLNEKNGKMVPEKVGLKAVQRDGLDYEFTIVLDLDNKHHATASKDRTNLFISKPEFSVTVETGKLIRDWCQMGEDVPENSNITKQVISEQELLQKIDSCKSLDELLALFSENPVYQETHLSHFTQKRESLQTGAKMINISQPTKFSQNGSLKQ